jgi:hypothetical protein
MMKISIEDNATVAALKIEGKVVGPWATELGERWRDLVASSKRTLVQLDIRGVTFVDQQGTRILQDIVRETGAKVLADSPLTQHFANQVEREMALDPGKEK